MLEDQYHTKGVELAVSLEEPAPPIRDRGMLVSLSRHTTGLRLPNANAPYLLNLNYSLSLGGDIAWDNVWSVIRRALATCSPSTVSRSQMSNGPLTMRPGRVRRRSEGSGHAMIVLRWSDKRRLSATRVSVGFTPPAVG